MLRGGGRFRGSFKNEGLFMDQESIVYGCIKDVAKFNDDAKRRRANRFAMLTLPKSEDWPYLCQEMFAIPKIEVTSDNYHTEVMHFGASYKAIEYEWEHWMKKFEALLSKMYWISAVVHLETELTGIHTFTWESKSDAHVPGMDIQQVHCAWTQENSFL